jgi:hypothetical protein
VSPVALSVTVPAEQTTVVLLDLVVVALSDEPGGGYELHIKEASVVSIAAPKGTQGVPAPWVPLGDDTRVSQGP